MKEILKAMKRREDILKRALSVARHNKRNYPEGHLRVSTQKGIPRYYRVIGDGNHTEEYISSKNLGLVQKLATKDYTESFIKVAEGELHRLDRMIRLFEKDNADIIYENLPYQRRAFVEPYIPNNEEYANRWESMEYDTNSYYEERKIYETRKGDKVRSKSEAILADMLLELGIPYHYEQALYLDNGAVRYPDFTLLQKSTRKEVFLEHFGLLDDEEYRNDAMRKLDEYRNFGIYPGKNLIITYESRVSPLDIKGIRKMLAEMFVSEA